MPENQNCNEAVYGEEYFDLIIENQNINWEEPGLREECSQRVNDQLTIFYLNQDEIPEVSLDRYRYVTIPKLLTTLDLTALEVSGITQLQSQPVLELRGEGMLIGFVDTGERVIIMSG